MKPPLPHTPGQEVAGRVAEVGAGVDGFRSGDRVLATVRGGLAEYSVAPAAAVRKLPDAMRFSEAAGFSINYVTALHALRDRARLAERETGPTRRHVDARAKAGALTY